MLITGLVVPTATDTQPGPLLVLPCQLLTLEHRTHQLSRRNIDVGDVVVVVALELGIRHGSDRAPVAQLCDLGSRRQHLVAALGRLEPTNRFDGTLVYLRCSHAPLEDLSTRRLRIHSVKFDVHCLSGCVHVVFELLHLAFHLE